MNDNRLTQVNTSLAVLPSPPLTPIFRNEDKSVGVTSGKGTSTATGADPDPDIDCVCAHHDHDHAHTQDDADEHQVRVLPNLALWVNGEHQIYQKEEPFPLCPPDHCVIHIKAAGICGSDLHFWKDGRIGDFQITRPLILGHEGAGEIIQIGPGVTSLKVGDRVSIDPGMSCLACEICMRGRSNLCPGVKVSGTPSSEGGLMRRYVAHPAKFLHKMPKGMEYPIGALIEPLAVAFTAVNRSSLKLGQPVLVVGAGPIGLSVALCARAAGAHPICLVDPINARLEKAESLGFHMIYKVDLKDGRMETARKIRQAMGEGCEPQVAFECAGTTESINAACFALQSGGTLLQVGCGAPSIDLPLTSLVLREINIITSLRFQHCWPTVMRLVQAGVLGDVTQLITHKLPVDKTLEAFEIASDRTTSAIKVMIVEE